MALPFLASASQSSSELQAGNNVTARRTCDSRSQVAPGFGGSIAIMSFLLLSPFPIGRFGFG
jgi:hypothetical protein